MPEASHKTFVMGIQRIERVTIPFSAFPHDRPGGEHERINRFNWIRWIPTAIG